MEASFKSRKDHGSRHASVFSHGPRSTTSIVNQQNWEHKKYEDAGIVFLKSQKLGVGGNERYPICCWIRLRKNAQLGNHEYIVYTIRSLYGRGAPSVTSKGAFAKVKFAVRALVIPGFRYFSALVIDPGGRFGSATFIGDG